jgi:hypothetical protein
VSVEFEPVRLDARRRRVDPVAVGTVVVAIALVISVVKPWDGASIPEAVSNASIEAAAPAASQFRNPAASAALPAVIAARAESSPTWAQIEPVARRHEAWGIRAIVREGGRYVERWFEFPSGGAATPTMMIDVDDRSIVALGVTFPPSETPLDVRIWRETSSGLSWVDTEALDPVPSGGAFLYARPGIDDGPRLTWASGSYRVDVLVDGSVRRFGISIVDRFSNIPPRSPRPNLGDLRPLSDATETTLPDVPFGLFAIANGMAVSLPADEGESLDEAAAWLNVDPGSPRAPRSFVAAAYVPRATTLGVMLASRVIVMSASISRLAPEPLRAIVPVMDHTPRDGAPSTSVMFRASYGGAWDPGVYRIEVVWADFEGLHEASWHAELRPGPVRELPRLLSAARSWARFAGTEGVILGMAEPLVGGPRSAMIRLVRLLPETAAYPVASGIGCGGTVIDGDPGILGFAYPDDHYASTAGAQILRPFLRRGSQVMMTAAFGLRGLILVSPARRPILAPGTYRFTIGDGEQARDYALCLDMQTFDD